VQQSEAPVASLTRVTEPSAAAETEANAAGQGVVQGESLSVTRQPQAVVARQEEGGAPATPTADRAAPAGAAPATTTVAEKGEAIEEVSEAEAKATIPEDDVIKYYWAKRKGPRGRKWASGIHSQVDKIFWARFGLEEGYKLDPRKAKDKALVPQWFKVLVEVLMPVATGPSAEVPDLKEVTVTLAKASIKAGTAKKKQKALDVILSEVQASKMPNLSKCKPPTIKYDPTETNAGLTSCTYYPTTNVAKDIKVTIGDAFNSISFLYSTMRHEYVHVNQYLTDPKGTAGNPGMTEFVAYTWEIYHAHETGLIKEPEILKSRGQYLKTEGWDKMKWYEKILNLLTYWGAIKIIRDEIGDKTWTP